MSELSCCAFCCCRPAAVLPSCGGAAVVLWWRGCGALPVPLSCPAGALPCSRCAVQKGCNSSPLADLCACVPHPPQPAYRQIQLPLIFSLVKPSSQSRVIISEAIPSCYVMQGMLSHSVRQNISLKRSARRLQGIQAHILRRFINYFISTPPLGQGSRGRPSFQLSTPSPRGRTGTLVRLQ